MNDSFNLTAQSVVKSWKSSGLQCVLRHGIWGVPCGYVGVPKEHPLFGKCCGEEPDDLSVHGGVTFCGSIEGFDLWFLGFDTAHYGDLFGSILDQTPIWTDEKCINETESLAAQIAALGDGA